MPESDLIDVTVWLLVDSEGRAVSDCLSEHLRDEYEADHGRDLDPRTATQLYRLTVAVARPRPIAARCVVPAVEAVEVAL